MFSKYDKAWISGAVSFVALTALTFLDIDINVTMQASIVSVITMALTFFVPNKT